MFPWRPDKWGKVLGIPSLVEVLAKKLLWDKNTVRAVLYQRRRPRASTIKNSGMPQIQSMLDLPSVRSGKDEGEIRAYSGIFKILVKLSNEGDATGLSLHRNFMGDVLNFSHTICAILWTESVYLDCCERKMDSSALFGDEGPFASFVAGMSGRQPTKDFDAKLDLYYLHLHHALMLFLAALDLDVVFEPEQFFPKKEGERLRRPMYAFVGSMCVLAGVKSWAELARKVGDTRDKNGADIEFQIRRWANAPNLRHCWSWRRLGKLLDQLGVGSFDDAKRGGDKRRGDIFLRYAIARIFQEHFRIIHPSLNRAGIADEDLYSFYAARFNACKENEGKRIPLPS